MFSDPIAPSNCIEVRSSIWRMYRDAADEDYLMARFAARSKLLYQFWWSGQQAVEKYLKAVLLLNNARVDGYGHKLANMYLEVADLAGDLLPALHCPPKAVRQRYWPNTNSRGFFPVLRFVMELEKNGDPNNRYRAYSVSTRSEYLIYFDELCFCLRRIAFPLDMALERTGCTAREHLTVDRRIQLHNTMSFESGPSAGKDDVWKEIFKWCNFAYFPQETLIAGEYPSWGGGINSELYLAYEGRQHGRSERQNAIKWIAERAFPKKLKQEISSVFSE